MDSALVPLHLCNDAAAFAASIDAADMQQHVEEEGRECLAAVVSRIAEEVTPQIPFFQQKSPDLSTPPVWSCHRRRQFS